MKTISVINLKGGVAKTFTAVNMAYELWRRGCKVLLIDNDKQGNLSKAFKRYDAERTAPIAKLLSGDWTHPDELIQQTDYEGMDVIASNMSLFGAAWNLTKDESEGQTERYKRLAQLETVDAYYDYCIIDNPPDIGINVINALAVTDEAIVPVKIDEDALEGLDIMAEQIEEARAINERIRLLGVLITSYQNTDGEAAGMEWLRQQGTHQILGVVRYSKKVAECSFIRTPIYEYSPRSAAAQDYKKFVTDYTGMER